MPGTGRGGGGGEGEAGQPPVGSQRRAQSTKDLQGWVLGTMLNQWPQHRVRVLVKFGTGEGLGNIASRMVAQKEVKDPEVQE